MIERRHWELLPDTCPRIGKVEKERKVATDGKIGVWWGLRDLWVRCDG